ncbi:DUF3131 domain-containing protein [Phaeobacter sp.]|uniref:DUF3131 domain-containing protein n=1 Tax=Phaeobacter sp. TaxID=1902409 RepID=UPI0025F6CA4A|nr:DUF3131 domain-containing protein [Phaeobacter sp.]
MKRRDFLNLASGGLAGTAWSTMGVPALAQGLSQQNLTSNDGKSIRSFSVMLTGVHPALSENALGSLIFAFLSQGIALSIELDFDPFVAGGAKPGQPVLALLDDLSSENRAFLELIPRAAGILDQTGYFKARQLWELRQAIALSLSTSRLSTTVARDSQVSHFSTVSTGAISGELRQDGLRAGGVTSVIYDATAASDSGAELGPAAVLMLPIKEKIPLRDAPELMTSDRFVNLGEGAVLAIDVTDMPVDPARSYDIGQRLAAAINRARLSNYLLSALPREAYKQCCRYLPNHSRHFVVLPDLPGTQSEARNLRRQAEQLLKVDCVQLARFQGVSETGGYILKTGDGAEHRLGSPGVSPDGVIVEGPVLETGSQEVPRADLRHPDAVFLHRVESTGKITANLPPSSGVCINRPAPIVDPAYELYTQARAALLHPDLQPVSPVFDADMEADAALAYTYLEASELDATGLAWTVRKKIGDRSFNNAEITMWDVGSLILGLLAAMDLGLVSENKAYSRIRRIMAELPVIDEQTAAYPPTLVNVQTGRVERDGFDACDFARLSSAVTRAGERPELAAAAAQLIDRWRVAGLMENGALNNILQTRIQTSFGSHCAHYLSRLLPQVGISDVRSPYAEAFQGSSLADRTIRLLNAVDEIGILPTEPLLLEYIELGPSAECAVLTDMFLGAMRHHYEQTGQLLAPSETPIDTAPWFVYTALTPKPEIFRVL